MDSNEKNLDNSLESAMNMTQEEIERFLAEQESQGSQEVKDFDDADLASLLSELGEEEDSDIQEISSLLNRADKNEAVADDVVALMQRQEAEGQTAYDAMDLFSGEQTEKKEGFLKRLLKKFKKKDKTEKTVEVPIEPVENVTEEPAAALDDNMAAALAMLGAGTEENAKPEDKTEKQKGKKEKLPKKKKEKKEKQPAKKKAVSEDEGEQIPEKSSKGKAKKEKKVKEKKTKEKKSKENRPADEPIREKKPIEKVPEFLEEEFEETPHKKKIIMIFAAAIMIMLGFLVVNHYFTSHASKQRAEEAYAAEDYLECYQLLYGQRLNDSQSVMFHRSELILKMDIFWNHYQEYRANHQLLESLNELVQFVFEYPTLHNYASEWNCQDTVEDTYEDVVGILAEDYRVSEQEAKDIAALEEDIDYTRALVDVIEAKKVNDAINQAYPDILPEEQDKISKN